MRPLQRPAALLAPSRQNSTIASQGFERLRDLVTLERAVELGSNLDAVSSAELFVTNEQTQRVKDMLELTTKGISFLKGNELHCKCSKAYPIVWLVPDYIEVNQESLDRFNGAIWKDFDEYKQHNSEITTLKKKHES